MVKVGNAVVLSNGSLELRVSSSEKKWQLQRRSVGGQSSSTVGTLHGVRSSHIPRIFGRGGQYGWPLSVKFLEKNPEVAEPAVQVAGIEGELESVTLSGSILTKSGKPTDAKLYVQYAMNNVSSTSAGVLLWRTWVTGLKGKGIQIDYIDLLEGNFTVDGGEQASAPQAKNRSIYVNGWQSWTFTGALRAGSKQPEPWIKYLNAGFHNKVMGGEMGKLNKGMTYRSDMFTCVSESPEFHGVDSRTATSPSPRSGVVLGWLSQRDNFGVVRLDKSGGIGRVSMVAECDAQLIDTSAKPTSAPESPEGLVERNHMMDCTSPGWVSPKEKLGADICTDWAYCEVMHKHENEAVQLENYFSSVGCFNGARQRESSTSFGEHHEVPVGWCSWYHFYEKISETKLLTNCETLLSKASTEKSPGLGESLPINLFLVDDGYTRPATWGDWTNAGVDNERFPHGMKHIADTVKGQGATPGLWMAPFAADKKSVVAKKHPDWPLRLNPYKDGKNSSKACNSAFPAKFFNGLDATNERVLEHVSKSIRTAVQEWGFKFIKLDFLYACILRDYSGKRSPNNRTNPHLNRAQAFNLGLRTIREAAGEETYILGCGCPLGPAVGWADAMRVSADAGPSWYPKLITSDKNNLPCGRNMVRNSLARIGMHSRWWTNDPDCLILRGKTELTLEEVWGIASCVALTGGVALISDDLQTVSAQRLSIGQVLVPVTGVAATAKDVLYRESPEFLVLPCGSNGDDPKNMFSGALPQWQVVGVANWAIDVPKKHTVSRENVLDNTQDDCELDVFEFWTQEYRRVKGKAFQAEIAAHSCKLFSVRVDNFNLAHCAYVGSDVHFTSGIEVSKWEDGTVSKDKASSELHVGFALPRKVVRGYVWIRLPTVKSKPPKAEGVTEQPVLVKSIDDRATVWKVPCSISSQEKNNFVGDIRLSW